LGTKKQTREGFEVKTYQIMNFSQDGCGHCTVFKPEWNKFKVSMTSYLAKDGTNTGIAIKWKEPTPATDAAMYEKYKISGTPTVIITDENGGHLSNFAGYPSTCQGLTDWTSSIIPSIPRDLCSR
jgi:thioredoxin-related protein